MGLFEKMVNGKFVLTANQMNTFEFDTSRSGEGFCESIYRILHFFAIDIFAIDIWMHFFASTLQLITFFFLNLIN